MRGNKTKGKIAGLLLLTAAGQFLQAPALADNGGLRSLRGDTEISTNNLAAELKQWQDRKTVFERNYLQQPPLIPHAIEGYAINNQVNMCLACHNWNAAPKTGATKIGLSHFRDRDGRELNRVSPRRYFCTQCHVPQVDAAALVENRFQPIDMFNEK